MAILSKGKTFTSGDQVTATGLNELVDNATFASGAVDDSTTQLSSGRIIVKDSGITSSKLNLSVNGASQNIAQFKTVQGSSARALSIRTPASTSDTTSPFEIETENAIKFIVDDHTVTIDSDGKTTFGNGSIVTSDTALHQVNINTDDALGATAGNSQGILRLVENASNTDNLLFTSQRVSNGSDWQTAAHRIQRKVDATKMGYIQFGNHTASNGGLITFGEDETERMRIDADGHVGIGTDSPETALHIEDASENQITLTNNTGNFSTIRSKKGLVLAADYDTNSGASESFMAFETDNVERLRILAGGDVGIGTTEPDGKLHVGTGNNSDGTDLDIVIGGDTANQRQSIIRKKIQSSDRALEIIASGNTDTEDIRFFTGTGSNEKIRILAGGNVGIGTSDPDEKLEVRGATLVSDDGAGDFVKQSVSGNLSALSLGAVQTTSSEGIVKLEYNRSTGKFHHYIGADAGTNYMTVTGGGNVGLGTDSASSELEVVGDISANNIIGREANNGIIIKSDPEAPDASTGGSQIALYSQDFTATRSQIYHRARYSTFQDIDETGIVVIGAQSGTNTLKVIGNIQYTGDISDISDRRLKENIEPLTGSLDKICQLEAKSYTMVDDEDKTEELGFIAQDVQQIFPNLVKENTDDEKPEDERGDPYLSVSYMQLIAPMVEAIKELKSENEALKARVATLES